jgi:hypothetical protein
MRYIITCTCIGNVISILVSLCMHAFDAMWLNIVLINQSIKLRFHLSMKEGTCFVVMRFTKPGCFRLCSWCLWKALAEEGCMGLVPCCLDLLCKSSWILIFSSLKIKLNRSWKFQRNWNVHLVLLERSWWAGFNGIYLVRYGFRMWEILNFKWFLLLKIQINSKKLGFGRKNQLRTWYTWANGTGHTSNSKAKNFIICFREAFKLMCHKPDSLRIFAV